MAQLAWDDGGCISPHVDLKLKAQSSGAAKRGGVSARGVMFAQPWLWSVDAIRGGQAWRARDSDKASIAEIARHGRRLALLAPAVGRVLGLPASDLAALRLGGLVHDIGKLAVPFGVLFKEGRLNEAEFAAVKSHAAIGDTLCARIPGLAHVRPIVRHHHERCDGSGYPDKLRGEEIPRLAEIVGMADVYDALVHPRPYKPAYDRQHALELMWRETAFGWRRSEVLEAVVAATEGNWGE